jgi:hypothetical protein
MPNPSRPATSGPIERVPCPCCGAGNDMRGLAEQQLLDTGSDVECDGCHQLMQITAVREVTMVSARPSANRPRGSGPPAAQQATTVAPGVLKRLLGR